MLSIGRIGGSNDATPDVTLHDPERAEAPTVSRSHALLRSVLSGLRVDNFGGNGSVIFRDDELIELKPQGHASLPWTAHLLDQDTINFGLQSFQFRVHIPAGVGTGATPRATRKPHPRRHLPKTPGLQNLPRRLWRVQPCCVDTQTASPRRGL
jgi:pSer/pThr/pTyr-binding forkhead associated (FHA) protein